MQSLLRGFHSDGKASKFYFLLFFIRWCHFFLSLAYKTNVALFLFSGSAYYRANWINYATIFVWVCWYGCQSVVSMCVIKKYVCVCVRMCVFVILREKNCKFKCSHCELQWGFAATQWGKYVTTPKQTVTESSFFEISSSNLEHNLFRFMALILL